jgi:hypothetical protein
VNQSWIVTAGKGVIGVGSSISTVALSYEHIEQALKLIGMAFGALVSIAMFVSISMDIARKRREARAAKAPGGGAGKNAP